MKNNQNPNRRDIIKTLTVTAAVGIVSGAATIQGQEANQRNEASQLDSYRGWRKRGPGRGFSSAFARYRR